jgi:hypothetical protein
MLLLSYLLGSFRFRTLGKIGTIKKNKTYPKNFIGKIKLRNNIYRSLDSLKNIITIYFLSITLINKSFVPNLVAFNIGYFFPLFIKNKRSIKGIESIIITAFALNINIALFIIISYILLFRKTKNKVIASVASMVIAIMKSYILYFTNTIDLSTLIFFNAFPFLVIFRNKKALYSFNL